MLRVTTRWSGPAGGPFYSTFHFDGNSQAIADDAAGAAVTFWNGMQAALTSQISRQVLPEVLAIDPVTGNALGSYVTAGGDLTAGGATGAPLPWTTQGLIRLRTGLYVAGREIRGRIFVPGLTEDANDNGRPNSSARSVMDSALSTLIADAGNQLEVWSPTQGQHAAVTHGNAWTEWAVLRSRRD